MKKCWQSQEGHDGRGVYALLLCALNCMDKVVYAVLAQNV
jgi:hypothetical protein